MHKQTLDPVVQTVVKVNSADAQNLCNNNQFVTVVAIGTEESSSDNSHPNEKIIEKAHEDNIVVNEFVTVLTVGNDENVILPSEIIEEVLVYRLPGERLGFGLKFEGGTKTTECVRRLFIQSCSPNSPASRVKCSWNCLVAGDEILKIDSFSVKDMTRIDCVRCLKESNVVIKLLVKHCNQQVSINEHSNISDIGSTFQTDQDTSLDIYSEQIRELSLPPPVPPRKMSRKMLTKIKNTNLIMPVCRAQSTNKAEVNTSNVIKDNRSNAYMHSGVNEKFIRPTRNVNRTRQIPDIPSSWIHIRDRDPSDVNNSPPNAEVYLDLLSQEIECGIRTESESDDTGSTISTVIDKHNSILIASNASSIASDSVPSTPRPVQKHIHVNNVINNPFEILEMEYGAETQPNNDYLFTRFVTSQDILCYEDGAYYNNNNNNNKNNNKKKSDFYKISFTPPANFQDAPLSYGNEDVNTIVPQNYATDKNNTTTQNKETYLEKSDDICNVDSCIDQNKTLDKTNNQKPKSHNCFNMKINFEENEQGNISSDLNLPRLVNFLPKNVTDMSPTDQENIEIAQKNINSATENTYIIELNNQSANSTIKESDHCSLLPQDDQLTINEQLDKCTFFEYMQNERKEDVRNGNRNEEYKSPAVDKCFGTLFNNWIDNTDNCKEFYYSNDNTKCAGKNVSVKRYTMDEGAPLSEQVITNTTSLTNNQKNVTENIMDEGINTKLDEKVTVDAIDRSERGDIVNRTLESSSLTSLFSLPLHVSSRLPPDGQEFPTTCDDPQTHCNHNSKRKTKLTNIIKSNDYIYTTPPCTISKAQATNNDLEYVRNFVWHKDKNSSGSVKDKIAIFSSSENNEPIFPNNNLIRNTKCYKSSENLFDTKSALTKNSQVSKSCLYISRISNNEDNNKKLIAISTQLNSNSDDDIRNKATVNILTKATNHVSKCPLLHSASMSKITSYRLPTRSQSMLDISNIDSAVTLTDICNGESRKMALNNLIEQRRRRLSKLRGLVIPQKEIAMNQPVLDLPEIRSKEQIRTDIRKSLESNTTTETGYLRNNSMTNLPSTTWKDHPFSDTFPKYSPAFKRKCLQIYNMEQPLQKTYDSDYKNTNKCDMFDFISNNNKNFNKSSSNTICKCNDQHSPMYMKCSSMLQDNSDIAGGISEEHLNNTLQAESQNLQIFNKCTVSNGRNNADVQKDMIKMGVNSNKSNYLCHEYSLSSSETNSSADNSIDLSSSNRNIYHPMTCESQEPKTFDTFTNNNNFSNRILKPQSVEAINRKNILASAKCRSGRDFKAGSPLIQRKFNVNEKISDEKSHKETFSSQVYITITNDANSSEKTEHKHNLSNDMLNQTIQQSKRPSSGGDIETFVNFNTTINYSENYNSSNEIVTNLNDQILSGNENALCVVNECSKIHKSISAAVAIADVNLSTPKTNFSNKIHTKTDTNMIIVPDTKQLLDNKTTRFESKPEINEKHDGKRSNVSHIKKQFESLDTNHGTQLNYHETKLLQINNTINSAPAKSETDKFFNITNSLILNDPLKNNKNNLDILDNVDSQLSENLEQLVNDINEGEDEKSDDYVNMSDVIVVVLHRETVGGSIGIILTGGIDYEAKNIVIHKVLAGSSAYKDGRLQKGDRVLLINGQKMTGLTHRESIEILKDPRPKVTIVIQRSQAKETLVTSSVETSHMTTPSTHALVTSPCVHHPITIVLRKEGAGLGFSLDGGRDSPKGDKPLIIKKIFTGGAAEKCGNLQAGDELLKINEMDVLKMTRIEVWSLMKKLPNGKVTLNIRRQ